MIARLSRSRTIDVEPRSATLSLRKLQDETAYEAALGGCIGVTGFHRWFFLSALAEALGFRFRAFAIDSGGVEIGVLPLLFRHRGPVSTVNYLPVPHVGPVLHEKQDLAAVLPVTDPYLLRQRTVVTKWSFGPGVDMDPEQLVRRGFVVSYERNYVVPNDRSPEDHLASLSPRQRRYLRQSQGMGMHAGPSTPEEIQEWFPNRVSVPYERQGIAPDYPVKAARKLAECLAEHPRMFWRSVRGKEGLLTISAWIIDDDRLWGWLMVNDRGPGPASNILAYQDAVDWSLRHNLACDFGGAPTDAIGEFKVRMGGQLEQVVAAERVRPAAYRTLRSLHTRLHHLMSA